MNKFQNKKKLPYALQYNSMGDFCEGVYAKLSEGKRVVLIAGASSSGKGYTSEYLARHLKQKGMSPLVLSTDYYYKGVSRSVVENAILHNENLKDLAKISGQLTKIVRESFEFSSYETKACEKNLMEISSKLPTLFFLNNLNADLIPAFIDAIKYEYDNMNYDLPSAVNLNKVASDVKKVLGGEEIIIPEYSFKTAEATLKKENTISGKDFDVVIVEGIFALRPALVSHLDKDTYISTGINCDSKTLLTRKLYRDLTIGRCSHSGEEIILNFLNQTMPNFQKFIKPTIEKASILFNSTLSQEETRLKSAQKQFKVRLSEGQYNSILEEFSQKNLRPKSCETQIDHYLSPKVQNNEKILVRVREVNGKAVGLTIKIKQEFANGQTLNVDEFDLREIITAENQDISKFLNNFKNAGFVEDVAFQKNRKTFLQNGFEFKLDDSKLGKFAEFDANALNSNLLLLFKKYNLTNITHSSYYDLKKREMSLSSTSNKPKDESLELKENCLN
ncbi:MAG: hypothetical protein IKT27_00345 [Clostridia bacterium]|nr:hypothetical protein [Clostridia bacterium]